MNKICLILFALVLFFSCGSNNSESVDRFADYLKKLTKETQFILITHRRGTMEKADRLYGITMQEKGITALVSVNLIEDQLS